MVEVEENQQIKGLLVVLNTVGGDVEAGLALAEMISSLSKPTVSIVLGGGHSIGSTIAVSTNYSFIAPSATMTIHPIRLTVLVIGVPATFEYLNKTQERVIDFTIKHSNISWDKLQIFPLLKPIDQQLMFPLRSARFAGTTDAPWRSLLRTLVESIFMHTRTPVNRGQLFSLFNQVVIQVQPEGEKVII